MERKAGGGGGYVIEGVPDSHVVVFLIVGPIVAIALVYLIMWIRSRLMKR